MARVSHDLIAQCNSLVAVNAKHIGGVSVISTQLAEWSFLQSCGYSWKIKTLFFFALGRDGSETQVKKLLNDRNSQMDLRHASEYDKLGQD